MARVALLTEIISPYRIPVFNALAEDPRIELDVLFFSETEARRSWRVHWEKIRFRYHVLWGFLIGKRYQGGPIFLNPGILAALRRGRYQAIICFGYHHPTIWLALLWCRFSRARALLWSESTRRDERSENSFINGIKLYLLGCFDGCVAAGQSQVDYLRYLGVAAENIYVAPDAVDSDFFTTETEIIRMQRAEIKRSIGVQGPIILCVGRLIDAKGIPELLDAFEQVTHEHQATLFLVGDGPDRERYQTVCRDRRMKTVRFEGFQPQEELPRYYGIADIFVFPTRSDPWGLVLNEAMCAGLPVICSTAAGASSELVHVGKNGFLHEPRDMSTLKKHMVTLLADKALREHMGMASNSIISGFTPQKMAQGFGEALFQVL